ncbi:MAG: leucyl aminopeptidase [Alcaligenaceae bacterium]|jgi:leucyl aminopeptidase|nr:leucyl aminopeptidase [Alcaligenaceae bacterium]HZJ98161.1 leucyl aminopeptidase [Oligella sp.]
MEFKVQAAKSIEEIKTPALIVGVYQDQLLGIAAEAIEKASKNAISPLLDKEFKASLGSHLVLRDLEGVAAKRIILIGLGKKEDYSPKAILKAHEAVAKACNDLSLEEAVNTLLLESTDGVSDTAQARFAARALENAQYRYTATLGKEAQEKAEAASLATITFITNEDKDKALKTAIAEGKAIAQGMALTRQLGNLPGNFATPTYLGKQAKALAKEYNTLEVQVLEKKQIEALKMGSFLSVAAGSEEPPRFIVLHHKPENAKKSEAPIVFVGKGVTFDTGGISLKPGAGMDEMKWDMGGAATVLGLFKFISEIGLDKEIVGLIPATENMPSGRATKPGDVVTSMSGQTIEILNTDAEGRLILCDALTYAERYEPKAVIDIATLTGACVIALGKINTGLFSNNDDLSAALHEAGKQACDQAWPMPLDEEYQEQLKSDFADMQNIGGREAGAITAAAFLARFTKKYAWAHLDVAGTAWDKSGSSKGSTGRPVPLLAQYLLDSK